MLYVKDGKLAVCSVCKKLRQSCPIHANCLGWWKLNDNAASTTVLDGKELHNGTCTENTEDINGTGKIDGALRLGDSDGISDAYITVAIDSGDTHFDVTDELSIALWFKTSDTDGNILIARFDTETFNHTFNIWVKNNGGSLQFQVLHSSGYTTMVSIDRGEGYWTDGEWHLVIAEFDKDKDVLNERHEIYIDNSLEGDADGYGEDIESPTTAGTNIDIGHAYTTVIFNGWLDNIIIFNKALSEDERTRLWNDGDGQEMIS